jgi:hypothetical protein
MKGISSIVRSLLVCNLQLMDGEHIVLGLGLVPSVPGGAVRPGVTPLPNNRSITSWLAAAVDLYKEDVVAAAEASGAYTPLLYMNLHQAAFPAASFELEIAQMAGAAAEMGLSQVPWAVYDVHNYFAWGGPDGGGIPAGNCDTDSSLTSFVRDHMANFTQHMRASADLHGLAGVSCSEWSLSTHHRDRVQPCAAPSALKIMYREQVAAFETANMAQFFWGWRMPMGGIHEAKWSLKFHLTGAH